MDGVRVVNLWRMFTVGCLGMLTGCGGGSGSDVSTAPLSGSNVVVDNNCAGESLRQKNYFLTVRHADSSDIVVNNEKLENIARPVVFEEVVVNGKPYFGMMIPIPERVPRNQALEMTILASEGDELPTCAAQLTHTVTSDNANVYVAELQEIPPKIGFRINNSDDSFDAVCNLDHTLSLDVVENPTAQLYGRICYVGQRVKFKYNVEGEALIWRSGAPESISITNTGWVTARGSGVGPITATRRNAQGTIGITSAGPGGITIPVVSMSNVDIQEGNDGVAAVAFTVQLATPGGIPLDVPIAIDFATTPGFAEPGRDYCLDRACNTSQEITGNVVIPAGAFTSTPIKIFVNGDAIPEADESFFVTLNPQLGSAMPRRAEVKLLNDDGPASKVYAKGVGIKHGGRGEIKIRAPAPGDKTFLVWNQKDPELSAVKITNETMATTFTVRARMLVNEKGVVPDGYGVEACFVAELPAAMLAATGPDDVNRYTIHGAEILDGAGMVVVTDLMGNSFTPSFSKGLQTVATFADGRSDVVGHHVEIKAGCDFFFHGTKDNENSEVVTFQFSAAEQDRVAKITFFASDVNLNRGSDVLYWAGNDNAAVPKRLDDKLKCREGSVAINCVITLASDLIPTRPALAGNNGLAWDTFGQYSGADASHSDVHMGGSPFRDPDLRGVVVVPAGASSVSVQLISPLDRNGESATLSLMALEIFPPRED